MNASLRLAMAVVRASIFASFGSGAGIGDVLMVGLVPCTGGVTVGGVPMSTKLAAS
jgi:hypothetical protein